MNRYQKCQYIIAILFVTTGIALIVPYAEGDAVSSDSVTITGYILQPTTPVADFSAIPTSGPAPLTVQFSDLSSGTPTEWNWDFENDGTIDSMAKNPSHVFTNPGTYSVYLSAANAYGSDTELKNNLITVITPGPIQRIDALDEYVNGLSVPEWSKWFLKVPLRNAERALQRGHDHSAVLQMQSFIRNVQLVRWLRLISQSQANTMIAEAHAIIELIRA